MDCAEVAGGVGALALGVGSLAFASDESLGVACSVEVEAVSGIGVLFDDSTTGGVVDGGVGVEPLGPQPNANEKKTKVANRVCRLGMGIVISEK
jgi:hypothetical protein